MRPILTLIGVSLLLAVTACSGGNKESFRNVDHDTDGKISYEELLFVFPGLTRETFAEVDTDHDGTLSESEYHRFVKDGTLRAAAEKAPSASAPAAGNAAGDINQPAVPYKGEEVIEIAPPASEAIRSSAATVKGRKKLQKGKSGAQNPGEATQYTVVRGDNLSRIAQRFGVSVDAIVRANGNMPPDTLRDGQVLTIPARP